MAFSEAIKLAAKRKAHFKCCICQRPSVSLEVHHIIPQADGGTDDEDNAAPLCPTCHEEYGANPEKRTAIRVQRDCWYEMCERRYAADADSMQRLIGLLEGATATFTGFQEYVNRLTRQDAVVETRSGSVSVTGYPATVHVTAHDSAALHIKESFKVETVKESGDEEEYEDEFQQEPRTAIEILEALDKLFDQIWYNRHWGHRIDIEEGRDTVTPEIWKMMLAAAARVEEKYRDDPEALGPWSDFEWGMLNGKMSALRWVLGDEWDFLDT